MPGGAVPVLVVQGKAPVGLGTALAEEAQASVGLGTALVEEEHTSVDPLEQGTVLVALGTFSLEVEVEEGVLQDNRLWEDNRL